ncbi:MAG: glycerol-3-phosphate dehydrogenase subunit GlpB [Proteobacteria bacterium]|nr:glycerol-3-phosphate dehydrogenase subunit GlpB [Pseudomonadota bacterium]
MTTTPDVACDLFIIGEGLAGMSSALFAVNRGLRVCQVGKSYPLGFHSGLLDLLCVNPAQASSNASDPWDAMDYLKKTNPKHPYAKIHKQTIRTAFHEVKTFLAAQGLFYEDLAEKNSDVATSIGTLKRSYMIPLSMQASVQALKKKWPVLFVGVNGLREFSATQIKETLSGTWPGLNAVTLDFPFSRPGEKTCEHLARALDSEKNRALFANIIRPHLNGEKAVGLPPILGVHHSTEALRDMEHKLGIPVFEIPCLPPSVPGLRLKEAFEQGLDKKGRVRLSNFKIDSLSRNNTGEFFIRLSTDCLTKTILAKGIVLSSGRFMGKGLVADRQKIKEAVFNFPVVQPEGRSTWFQKLFFDDQGHAINKAGIETDSFQRPINDHGDIIFDNVFAAGSILAHQDWAREKSGSGIAMSSGLNAVNAFIQSHHVFQDIRKTGTGM